MQTGNNLATQNLEESYLVEINLVPRTILSKYGSVNKLNQKKNQFFSVTGFTKIDCFGLLWGEGF